MKKLNQWLSIKLAKRPGAVVLGSIFLFNILFFLVSVLIFKNLNLKGTEEYSFFDAAYLTITMILDAGCISYVIDDIDNIGIAGVSTAITCLVIIFIGMISFTGAVIGYITNYISDFMEKSNSGYRKLKISNHTVILNWNSRASEIINDMLYCRENQNVVVLVSSDKARVENEINERITDTIAKYKKQKKAGAAVEKICKLTVVVREGDVFSYKQLQDISLKNAKAVIILGDDINNSVCAYESMEMLEELDKGNTSTVKSLMQVADITGNLDSADDQKVIVEITDDWTEQLVDEIIKAKMVEGKSKIVPVRVNKVLGQLLSQFSITPELNNIYTELFSNQGATFFSKETDAEDEIGFVGEYLKNHKNAIPLSIGKSGKKKFAYYSAASEDDLTKPGTVTGTERTVAINKDYWLERRHVIILGHNSNIKYIMRGFESFCREWNRKGSAILDVVIVDDKKNVEKMNYYREYPFVSKIVESDVYDREKICEAINSFVSAHTEDTSILILSDDRTLNKDKDANALANLIYVQDIILQKKKENPDFRMESMDVIVELIDPKHHDIVNNYSGYNIVISNRYISKMILQVSEKDSLFDFYQDILSFDENADGEAVKYDSKEIYAKKVSNYFTEVPDEMTASELIRAVYKASTSEEIGSMAIVLGYVTLDNRYVLFDGDQDLTTIKLKADDKIIVFSAH